MVAGTLLSLLARQHVLLKHKFAAQHPYPWLLWQPHEQPPPPMKGVLIDTWVPGRLAGAIIEPDDAVCYELGGAVARFHVGRGEDGELIVDVAPTASDCCVLVQDSAGWSVGASVDTMRVSGNPLAPGIEVPLQGGDVLDLGGLALVFLDALTLVERVSQRAAKL